MTTKYVELTAKLGVVKENLFTVQGSTLYFIPRNKNILRMLSKWSKGQPLRIKGKKSDYSNFFIVSYVFIDKYRSVVKAKSRRAKAYNEMNRLLVENKSNKMRLNKSAFHSGGAC